MSMFISLYHVNAVFFFFFILLLHLGVRVFKQTEIKCVSVFARTPPDITLCFCFTVSTCVFISLLISLMPIPPTLVSAILVETGLWPFHVRRMATVILPLLQDKLCFMEMFIWTKLTRMEPESLSLSHSLCQAGLKLDNVFQIGLHRQAVFLLQPLQCTGYTEHLF